MGLDRMFANKTVFILGAGASWHYSYPTGEDLVTIVIDKAEYLAAEFREMQKFVGQTQSLPTQLILERAGDSPSLEGMRQACGEIAEECMDLAQRLKQVRPLVIDYFLGQNPKLQKIGKLLIAWAILECEAFDLKDLGNDNRRVILVNSPFTDERARAIALDRTKYRDNWYRFIVHNLVASCVNSDDLLNNDVMFVTFNYDTSLEHHFALCIKRHRAFLVPGR
jgi:hypothetical protein